MENYFNYFTEIEEHFQRRWGGILRFSPLDWALIETWKEAGIPLQAVLRGIDVTFEHYEHRPSKTRKVNGLGFCAQEVLAAAEDMKEAAVGTGSGEPEASQKSATPGFEPDRIAAFFRHNANLLEAVEIPESARLPTRTVTQQTAKSLRELAAAVEKNSPKQLQDLERRLTVMEEKLFAALLTATSDEEIVTIRAEADRDLTAYRRKMSAAQIDQLQKQYVHKRLLEKYRLPRLSLFYL